MKKILIAIFVIFYLGNSHICDYYFDPTTIDGFSEWWGLRSIIYEFMFVVVLATGFFKPDIWSRCLLILTISLVTGSLVDKIQGVRGYHLHDILLFIGAIWASYEVYKKWKKQNQE